jgi:hypothetical protein
VFLNRQKASSEAVRLRPDFKNISIISIMGVRCAHLGTHYSLVLSVIFSDPQNIVLSARLLRPLRKQGTPSPVPLACYQSTLFFPHLGCADLQSGSQADRKQGSGVIPYLVTKFGRAHINIAQGSAKASGDAMVDERVRKLKAKQAALEAANPGVKATSFHISSEASLAGVTASQFNSAARVAFRETIAARMNTTKEKVRAYHRTT